MNESVYCSLPWMQLMISPSGDYKVCCFSGNQFEKTHGFCLDENDKPMNVLTHTMHQALNSKTSASIRKAQLDNKRHPECSVCWNRDDDKDKSGATMTDSFRVMRTFNQFPKWNIETAYDVITTSELKIRSLDLRFTNKCNLKCVMCTPLYSSLWYEDYTKIHGNTFGDTNKKYTIFQNESGKFTSDIPQWYDTDIWKKRFDEVKGDLRHLYITGGEPFLVKGHLDMLDDLIECDLAKNIVIDYDTNLTVINHKILERFSKFKKIIISVSFDDIGERYNYIRFPGEFDVVKNNLKFLIDNKSDNVTVKSISCCLGVLNILAPFRFSEFVKSENLNIHTSFRLLRYPDHFDIKYLPKNVKDSVLNYYHKSDDIIARESLVIGHLQRNYDLDDSVCRNKIKEHVYYLSQLDSLRNLDWKKTFPETYELLKNGRIT